MPTFERYLTVWVFLCIVVGVALGHVIPGVFQAIGTAEVAKVNLPVAVRIWLMIIPMLLKIDFASLNQVGCHWRGIGVTLFINWAVKPFPMALLGWLFVGYLFRPYLPVDQIDSCIAGLIILAVAKGREQVPRSWRMSASKAPGRRHLDVCAARQRRVDLARHTVLCSRPTIRSGRRLFGHLRCDGIPGHGWYLAPGDLASGTRRHIGATRQGYRALEIALRG